MLAQSGERQRSGKRRLREGKRTAANRRSALRKCRNAVSAGVLSPISSAVGRNGAVGDKESARAGARNYPRRRQKKALAPGREIAPAPAAGGGRKKDRRGRSFCLLFGCTAYWDLFCSFWSMAVNSGGRGQWSSTGSPVRGWMKRRPVAWRHWPVRPGTGFLAP